MIFQERSINRRVIYLLVFVVLAVPLALGITLTPARMQAAEDLYVKIDTLEMKQSELVFVALDYTPGSKAENESQARVLIEHLMRKRIPFAVFSLISQAESFLKTVPQEIADSLMQEKPGEYWEYGKDWVNLGYQFGTSLFVQKIPKSQNLKEIFSVDTYGTSTANIPIMKGFQRFDQIKMLIQVTGLVGVLDIYLQFFQSESHRPMLMHGCTSITIPESYIYLDSGQITGLLEGLAGAAWYSHMLSQEFSERPADNALLMNTGLGVAQLLIIVLIIIGNIVYFLGRKNA